MEGQLIVAESVHLFDEQGPENLVPGHAWSTCLGIGKTSEKVLLYEFFDARIVFEDAVDHCQFFGVIVLNPGAVQRELWVLAAHKAYLRWG